MVVGCIPVLCAGLVSLLDGYDDLRLVAAGHGSSVPKCRRRLLLSTPWTRSWVGSWLPGMDAGLDVGTADTHEVVDGGRTSGVARPGRCLGLGVARRSSRGGARRWRRLVGEREL